MFRTFRAKKKRRRKRSGSGKKPKKPKRRRKRKRGLARFNFKKIRGPPIRAPCYKVAQRCRSPPAKRLERLGGEL